MKPLLRDGGYEREKAWLIKIMNVSCFGLNKP